MTRSAFAYEDGPGEGSQITLTPSPRRQQGQDSTVFSNERPQWATDALRKLGALIDLKPGWDGHFGMPITHASASYAFDILRHVMQPGVPLPSITPLSYGGVQLEWHRKGWDVEIEVPGPGKIYVFTRDIRSEIETERELSADFTALGGVIDKIKN